MMYDQLTTLAGILEDAAGIDAVVTVGRPAAPSGEDPDCSVIYVWGQQVFDLDQDNQTACFVKARWSMFYEIHTCYPEGFEDQIQTEAAQEAAERLYGLMSDVWCALVAAKDNGELCADNCYTELAPLEVQPRLGGAVSALGGVTIPYSCPVVVESPTSP